MTPTEAELGLRSHQEFIEQGLAKAGVKLIGTGDVTDDDQLNGMGDAALGVVTTHHYSAAHDSPENKAFVAAFEKANGFRPTFMAVAAYYGMALFYHALEATKGDTATLKVLRQKGDESDTGEIAFVRENGEWKMLPPQ